MTIEQNISDRLRKKRHDAVADAAANYIEKLEMSVRCLLYALEAENPLALQKTIEGAKRIRRWKMNIPT